MIYGVVHLPSAKQTKRNGSDVLACDVFRFLELFGIFLRFVRIFEIKVRDEFTLKMSFYTYIYIFTASVVKRARMLINSIGSSWEGFG